MSYEERKKGIKISNIPQNECYGMIRAQGSSNVRSQKVRWNWMNQFSYTKEENQLKVVWRNAENIDLKLNQHWITVA